MVVNHNEEGVTAASCGSLSKKVGLTVLGDVIKKLLYTGSSLEYIQEQDIFNKPLPIGQITSNLRMKIINCTTVQHTLMNLMR